MTRTRAFVAGGVVLVLIGVAVLVGVLAAQENSLKNILKDAPDDDVVVATVNGHDFTTQQLRVGYESHMLVEPDLTENEVIKATILSRLDAVLLASEAESRGLMTTQDEARALVERNKAVCEEDAEIEAECRDVLEKMGFDYDEYWEEAVSVYQENHTALKAMSVLREQYLEREGTDAEGEKLDWLVIHKVRENADIVWHDNDIKALYAEAVVARVNELGPPPVPPTPPGGPDDAQGPVGNVND